MHFKTGNWVVLLAVGSISTLSKAAEITVVPPATIQSAIDQAVSGDTIFVQSGIYHESLHVDKANITLRGIIKEGQRPILEGDHKLNDGIIASGSGFVVDNLQIQHYKGNGITTQGASNVLIRNLIVRDTGIYGIYPSLGKNVRVEGNVVSGISDAGIYTGMCQNVDIIANELYENVGGIEVENSEHVLVQDNLAYNNTSGILIFALPGLATKKLDDVLVRHNFVIKNNHRNFAESGAIVANVPPGTGILLLAADGTTMVDNIIRGNSTAGILIADMNAVPRMVPDPEVDPNPDRNRVLENVLEDNGKRRALDYFRWYLYVIRNAIAGHLPEDSVKEILPPSADIFYTDIGTDNCVLNKSAYRMIGGKDLRECTTKDQPSIPMITTMIKPASKDDRVMTSKGDVGLGAQVYNTVCVGCHAMQNRFIGPPVSEIRAKYKDNPDGIVKFASNPKKVRADFPDMPSQQHLGPEKLSAAAKYMLGTP